MSRQLLVVVGVCILTLFAGLGRPAITDSDEGFYAESAREMVETGDWLTPHFNYAHRFEKPVLYYWLASLSYLVVGVNEVGARLPSAFAGLGLSLLMYWVGSRWHDRTTGLLAGIVTATSFGHVAMARQALPDLTLSFLITMAIWSALNAWLDDPDPEHSMETRERQWWVVTSAVAAGAAVLTKGPIGIVLPALVVGPLLAWEYASGRSERQLKASHVLLGSLVFLVVVLPWFAGMTATHGVAYLDRFFVGENLDRFATARYNDPRAWWYYLPIVVGGMLPWSPYMLLWIRPVWSVVRGRRPIPLTTLRLSWWAVAPLLFYTLSVGKQPRYVLPMLGPLALLLATTLRPHLKRPGRANDLFAWSTGLAGFTLIVIGGLVHRAGPLFGAWHPSVLAILAAFVIGSGIAVCASTLRREWTAATLTVAAIVAALGAHYIVLATPGPSPVERMASMITEARQGDERYGRHAVFNRNLVFYTGLPFVELPILRAADELLREPDRVLCALRSDDLDRLREGGLSLTELGEVTYLNTGSLNLRTLLDPSPDRLERVVLVANR